MFIFHKLASLLLIFFIVWVILVSPQIKHSYLDTASTLMTLLMTFTGENKNVCSFPDRRKINEFHMMIILYLKHVILCDIFVTKLTCFHEELRNEK